MFASRELKRSESDIITQAPLSVQFGEVIYKVKPLRILKAMEWRKTLMAKLNEVGVQMTQQADGERALMSGLGYVLLKFPEVLVELVMSYSPELQAAKDKIMDDATEEQMAKAFGQIMGVAFPYQGELKTILSVLGTATAATSRPSQTSTKLPSANGAEPQTT